jgi:hypothetical protein
MVNPVPQFRLANAVPNRLARTHVNLPEIDTLQWFDGRDRSLEDSGESSKSASLEGTAVMFKRLAVVAVGGLSWQQASGFLPRQR